MVKAELVRIKANTGRTIAADKTVDISESHLVQAVRQLFDLTPDGIIRTLALRRPIYKQTAAYGHFGRQDVVLPWEQVNKVDELKAALAE